MAKKKSVIRKVNKNFLLPIAILVLLILGMFIFQQQTYKNTSLINFPTPKPVELQNSNDGNTSGGAFEEINVYLSDGTETSGRVGKNWNNGRFARVNVKMPNGAGSNQILKYIDGKWVSINFEYSQNYLCTHFTNTGMTEADLNDLIIRQKNGVCSAWITEEEYNDWNPDPAKFSD